MTEANDAIPLATYASQELAALARTTGAAAIAQLDGQTLLGERAARMNLRIPGTTSAGGGCRLYRTKDGWIALNLARADDRALLPALFEEDFAVLEDAIAAREAGALVERGREMGLAIAAAGEASSRGVVCRTKSERRTPPARTPLVIDLSALWAGPLATHLLWLAGATVVKVESRARPDAMRDGASNFFSLLNQGKASVALDFRDDRAQLIALLRAADIVIEAARPRALLQLGIDADEIVRHSPGLVWVSITAHGGGKGADWVGFGDDCSVAAGLTDALHQATGEIAFVGDAIADPLTGLKAARLAWEHWSRGQGARLVLSMRDATATALIAEQRSDAQRLRQSFEHWVRAKGAPFPKVKYRDAQPARTFDADTAEWASRVGAC